MAHKRLFQRFAAFAAAATLAGALSAGAARAQAPKQRAGSGSPTLDAVRERRLLLCGVSGESPGFSLPDSQGEMRGLDADTCRAVAAGKNPLDLTAGELMSTPVTAVTPEATVEECVRVMEERQVRRVPVVDEEGRRSGDGGSVSLDLGCRDRSWRS